jgi:hypothetical protein
MIATPVAAGTRSSVRHEPSDNADTAIPEAPSGREPITPATLPPRDVRHRTAAARPGPRHLPDHDPSTGRHQ